MLQNAVDTFSALKYARKNRNARQTHRGNERTVYPFSCIRCHFLGALAVFLITLVLFSSSCCILHSLRCRHAMNIKRDTHTSNCSFSKFNIFIIIAIRCVLSACVCLFVHSFVCAERGFPYLPCASRWIALASLLFVCIAYMNASSCFFTISWMLLVWIQQRPCTSAFYRGTKYKDRISINLVCVIYRQLIKLSSLGFNFIVMMILTRQIACENRMDDNFQFGKCPHADVFIFNYPF